MKKPVGLFKKVSLVVLGLAFVPFAAFAATTIGTNISTNGNLTVDGNVKFTNGAGVGYILQSDGAGNATWLNVSGWDQNAADDLTTATTFGGNVSGTYNNISVNDFTIAGQATGDILYFDGVNWAKLTAGADGKVLTLASGLPSWAAVSYTETDPVFGASAANGISAGDIANWNAAFGWGNHALAGYLTSESDPIWVAAEPNYGNLGQAETITGNWVNTANPWADNEVAALSGGVQGDILYRNGTSWTALAPGVAGQYLQTQGAGDNPKWATSSGSPGGVDTNVQYNDGGPFGGDGNFTWNKTSKRLVVTTDQSNPSFSAARTGVTNGSNVAVASFDATPASGNIGSMITIGNGNSTGYIMMDQQNKLGFGIIGSMGAAYIDSSNNFYVPATLKILESGASPQYYTNITAGDQTGNINYTLPTADGSSGQILSTNGSGVLSWVANSSMPAGTTTDSILRWSGAAWVENANVLATAAGNLTANGDTILGDAAGDTLTFNASTLSVPNDLNIDSDTLYIDATNNRVGIGTNAPNDHLSIVSNIDDSNVASITNLSAGGSASAEFQIYNDTSFVGTVAGTSTGFTDVTGIANSYVSVGVNHNAFFGTAAAGDISIGHIFGATMTPDIFIPFATGHVGIETASPNYPLQVHLAADKNVFISNGVDVPTAVTIGSANDANDANIPIEFRGTEYHFQLGRIYTADGMSLNNTALNPAAGIFIATAGTDQNFVIQGGQGLPTGVAISAINDANDANVPMEFRGSKYYFDSGKVGIGTTSFSAKLEVSSADLPFLLDPRGSPPATAVEGGFYTDSTTHRVYYYNGTSWLDLTAGASAGNVYTALNLTDNALVRGDGGTTNVQTTGITVDDSDNLSTGGNITVDSTHYIKLGPDYISSGGGNFTFYGYNAWFDGGWHIPDVTHASVVNMMNDVDGFVLWETTSVGSTDLQWRFSVSPQGNVAIGRPVNTSTPNFYQYGYVTSASTSKYVAFTLLTSGYYALQRQDSSVNGFNINMPLGIQETGASPTYHTYFQGGDQTADVTYTLPTADGSSGQVLATDGSGTLSWVTGNGDITAVGSMTSGDAFAGAAADNNWLGLGAGAGRIEFHDLATDYVNILDANVGIGTNTPADKLSIETNVNDNAHTTMTNLSSGTGATAEFQVYNDSGLVGTMAATSTGYTDITGGANVFAVVGMNHLAFFGTDTGGDVAIGRILGATMNKDIYIPNATGYVGIGATAPATPLHVLGYNNIDGTDVIASFSSSDATKRVYIGYDHTGDFGEISAAETGVGWENLILGRYGGNIGIGTDSPDVLLDVAGDLRIEDAHRLYFGGTGAGDTLGNIYHDGTDFILSDDLKLGTQSALKFADADSSNWVALMAPATVSADVTWTLPAADGTSGQVLSTNGSGTLSWASNNALPTGTTTNSTLRWNGSAWVENTNLQVDANGFLTLGVPIWDDIRVPVTATTRQGSNDPTFSRITTDGAGSQGVFAYVFNQNTEEELYFTLELPNNYKDGTTIYPHVHWAPTTADSGDVVWGLEYTWANENGTLGNTTLTTVTDSTNSTANQHLKAEFAGISGTGKTNQSMIICRIYRKAADAGDTYAHTAALFDIDFDYEIDKLGSATQP